MRYFKRLTLVAALTLTTALPAAAETLADALVSAYRNSNLLDQNQAVLRAADEGVAQAIASLRPIVSYTAASSRSYNAGTNLLRYEEPRRIVIPGPDIIIPVESLGAFSTSFTLTASLTLYDFGRGKLGVEVARESVLATREGLQSLEQDVLFAAVRSYVDVRLQGEALAIAQSSVRLITQELRAARDRFEVGESTRTDVAQAEARLAQAQALEQSAQGALTLAREGYKAAVGNYPESLSPLPAAPRLPRSLEEARSIARTTHPAVQQLSRQVRVADLQIELAKAQFTPVLSGLATANQQFANGDLDPTGASITGTLSLSQTLYAGGQRSSLLRQAIAQQENARAGLLQTQLVIEQNVGIAWSNIEVASAGVQSADKQIRAAQAAYNGVKEEADLGARTTLDVLDAEQDLLDARFAKLQSEANLYLGIYQLLSATGLLTVEHLGLGVPTYDVEGYYNAVKNAPTHSPQSEALDRILKTVGN